MATDPHCPICGASPTAEAFPFCSSRCRLIDLGNWLGERYVVPGDPIDGPPEDPTHDDDGVPTRGGT